MNYLIIGGTGLISTSITRMLIEQGQDVTIYNRGIREKRFESSSEAVKQIVGNRKEYAAFEQQIKDAGAFDCVIDMITYTPADAESAVRAFRGNTGQYIFCSTVDVYARPAARYPYREDEPYGAASAYGRDKARCEEIFFEAHGSDLFPVTIIRPAHTYGEGGSIIHTFGWNTSFLDRLRQGKPVIVHGDGNSLWSSCYIDDVARAFIAAAGNERAYGKGYHVTGEDWFSWNKYYATVAEALGAQPPETVHIPTDLLLRLAPERARVCAENFQYNNIFDNSAARADLDFRYTVPLLEGMRRTAAWLERNGKIEDSSSDPLYDRIIAAWQQHSTGMAKDVQRDDA